MKNLKKALLILIVVVMALPACKKGENDPGISLKSRKARLTGEWKLKEGSTTTTSSSLTGSSTDMYSYNGSTCTNTYTGGADTYPYTEKIEIVKDGTFEWTITSGANFWTRKGSWYFGGKAKDLDLKNKESVVFVVSSEIYTSGTTSNYTYTGADIETYVLNIDRLSGKEMIIIVDGTDTGGSTSYTHSGTMTYEQ